MKKYKVIIDADFIPYHIYPDVVKEGDGESVEAPDISDGKKAFKEAIEEVMDNMAVLFEYPLKAKAKIIMSDETNFRYDIFPEYKGNRTQERTPEFYALRDWARKKYIRWKNCEADDVCGWYARFKTDKVIIVSNDKDVKFGLPGIKFDPYPGRNFFMEVSEYEANRFILQQTLAGDSGDSIPGIPRVGMKTAEKLLNELGWDWNGVVAAYRSKGLTEAHALLTRRLIGLDQLNKKKELELWKP